MKDTFTRRAVILENRKSVLDDSRSTGLLIVAGVLLIWSSTALAQYRGTDATKWSQGRPTPWLPNNGSPNFQGGIYSGTGGGGNGGGGNYGYGGGNRHGYGPNYGWGPQLFIGIDPQMYPSQGYIYYPSTASYNNLHNLNYGVPGATLTATAPAVIQPLDGNHGAGFPTINPVNVVVPPSSATEQETSLQFQTQGDLQLQRLNFLGASERYRKAMTAARDRPEPRLRLAITLAARSRYLEAVDQLKLMVAVDPTYPQIAPSLDEIFGAENLFEKTRVKERVGEWALQDVRDPNRLFLLGVMAYLDGQHESTQLLDTAVLLAGNEPHLNAFLMPRAIPIPQPAGVKFQEHGDKSGNGAPQKPVVSPPVPSPPEPMPTKQSTAPGGKGAAPVQKPGVPEDGTHSPIPSIPPAPTSDFSASPSSAGSVPKPTPATADEPVKSDGPLLPAP